MASDDPAGPRHVRRRTLTTAAWATPVIVAAAPAPVFASSGPVMSHRTVFRWFSNSATWCAAGQDGLLFNTTGAGTGVSVANTNTSTVITSVYAFFWWARSNIVWSADTGNSGCWSVPTATGISQGDLFQYRSNYTCAIAPSSGTTTLSAYAWRSQCFNESDTAWETARRVRRQAFATINGATQTTDSGIVSINS